MLLAALNLLLRMHIAWFLYEVMTMPDDPRFAGKAIPARNLAIVGGASLVLPAVQLLTRRWKRYPWGWDALHLSVYWLDMAGNSFDLYDSYTHFDLIPHSHGAGAMAALFWGAFGMRPLHAFLLGNGLHGALELQESLTDVFFGTHNVRAWWDQPGDLAAGLVGTTLYTLLAPRLFRRAATRA